MCLGNNQSEKCQNIKVYVFVAHRIQRTRFARKLVSKVEKVNILELISAKMSLFSGKRYPVDLTRLLLS